MIIDGGTGPTFQIIVDQIHELGINPEKISYIFLTHTHADHIEGIPRFKKLWPHTKVIASPVAAEIFKKKNDINMAKKMGLDVMMMNNYGSPLVYGHTQAPTAGRNIAELLEELVILRGGYGIWAGCAAGDTGASMIFKGE